MRYASLRLTDQPTAHRDPWGNSSAFLWDDDSLAITEVTDPLGLTVVAEIDYQFLSPSKVTDPNDTESQATVDPLGRVTATFVRNGTDGDGTDDGDESARYTYETDRWSGTDPQPARVKVELREAHGGDDWLTSYAYSDGGGQVIQTVTEAAPDGETERWEVSGRVEVDNKGNVVRQYEPFYADDYEFDFSPAGVSAVLEYDPIGRNIRMTLPDGHLRSWTYTPWQVSASDENDHDTGGDFEDTPAVTRLDSLGRVYKVAELTEISGTPLLTALPLDIQGNPLAVIDPRGNTIQVQRFDMLGRPLFTGAADEGYDPGPPENDKGQTRALLDVASKPYRTWRSGDLAFKQTYDQARRPLALYVTEDSVTRLVTLMIYGDAVSDSPTHSLGRPVQVYDTAGRVSLSYDFRGRVIAQTRQLHTEIETESNWDGLDAETSLANIESWLGSNADLETTTYTTTTTYDALDRPTEQVTPDSSRTVPGYNPGGQLTSVQVYVRGAEDPTDVVTEITYNARGQRETITYGNYTTTTTTYDPDRLWPTQILTERSSSSPHGAATLQDLSYTRDPVGNITQITDAAQETLYFDNTQVSPTRSFSYDALYRLTTATGREKSGLTQATPRWSDCGGATGGLPDAGDGESGTSPVLRRYTEVYTYDAAGNLTEVKHQNGTGGTVLWKRGYRVADLNNQLERTSIATDTYSNPNSYSDTYTYNDRGAMTYLPHLKTGAGDNLTRDFRDQIRRADIDSAGTIAHYAYDAAGQRIRKVVVKTSVVEERIYLGSYEVWRKKNLAGDLDEERETLHVLDGERRAALIETLTWEDETELSTPETRIRYQLDDHLGTACVELDEDGATISYEEYHPYGTTAWYADDGSLETSPKRYRYTGMERDEETGLQYHSARYYAPWLGRWCSADPIGLAAGLCRHRYCGGRPIRSCDKSGFAEDAPVEQLPEDPLKAPQIVQWGSPASKSVANAIVSSGSASSIDELPDLATNGTLYSFDGESAYIIQFPTFDPYIAAALGPQVTSAIQGQMAYLLAPIDGPRRAEHFGADLNHLHLAVPAEQAPAFVAALKRFSDAEEAAVKEIFAMERQIAAPFEADDYIGLPPEHVALPVVELAQAQMGGGQPLLDATAAFFNEVSQIPGAIIVYHTYEGNAPPEGGWYSPIRHYQFPMLSTKPIPWTGGSTSHLPVGVYSDGLDAGTSQFELWPAGTLRSTVAESSIDRIFLSGATNMESTRIQDYPWH